MTRAPREARVNRVPNGAPHVPVLLAEVLDSLDLPGRALAVDGTFGAGGYTRAMLAASGTRRFVHVSSLAAREPQLYDQLVDAMMAHPILINRPLVVSPLGVKLCRPSEEVLDLLPAPQQGAFTKEDGEQVIDADGNRLEPGQP